MARLRVFLIGIARADLAALRSRVANDAAMTIVGEALKADIDERRVTVPANVDAVLTTPALVSRVTGPTGPTTRPARSTQSPGRLVEELTSRERDVLALAADGYGNRAIAERLGLSEHTVKFHLASIFGKLGASTRTEAVRRGLELGIIDI